MTSKRTILVTGCSSGIGAYCARALRDDGWRVFVTARKPEDIQALRDDGFEAFHLEYADPGSIAKLVDDVLAASGGTLDALFNNGAHAQAGAVEDLPMEALRHQLEVNFFGWADLTRRIVPVMRAQGHGRIVFCSSTLGRHPMKWRGAYCASKYALEGLMLCMRMELGKSGIKVSLIEPGPIVSKIAKNGYDHFVKHIQWERSVYCVNYRHQLDRLWSGGTTSRFKLGPDAVYKVLKHALNSSRPKPHYLVTFPAKLAAFLRRVLPDRPYYYVLTRDK